MDDQLLLLSRAVHELFALPSPQYGVRQELEQSSKSFWLLSSHCSPKLTYPSPHNGLEHTEVHPSPLVVLPSSHCSEIPPEAEVYIWPPLTTAASFVPSEEKVMEFQVLLLSRAVHVTPLSVEVYIWPPYTTAASFVPSEEEVMKCQLLLLPRAVHVAPLSVEV